LPTLKAAPTAFNAVSIIVKIILKISFVHSIPLPSPFHPIPPAIKSERTIRTTMTTANPGTRPVIRTPPKHPATGRNRQHQDDADARKKAVLALDFS
jgi:hypothetical protein